MSAALGDIWRGAAPARVRALVALAGAVVAVIALSGGVAQAAVPKLIPYGNFPSEGPGVAVDQSSGEILTAGLFRDENEQLTGYGHIQKFSAKGELLSTFGNSYSGYGWFNTGAALNPKNGNVYVLEALGFEGFLHEKYEPEIGIYEPSTGSFIGSFPVASARNFFLFFEGCCSDLQIATDPSGNVYVPGENDIVEYSEAGTLLKTLTGGSGAGALEKPEGMVFDPSSGKLWVADTGHNRIEELESSGVPVEVGGKPVEIRSGGVEALALDGHGDILAIDRTNVGCGVVLEPCAHLVEYTLGGERIADVGAGSIGGKNSEAPSMVAVNEASGRVYVTDLIKHSVWVYGPPTAPSVANEFTAEVTTDEAKLGALVFPGGIPASYRFEYGTTTAYGSSTPTPAGSAGEGISSHAIWASANGLEPGATYHYRVVVSNGLGTATGPDRTFTTETAAQAACPNDAFRGGFSARLPDCRAYELAVPPFANGSQPWTASGTPDGNGVGLFTEEPLPGAPTGGDDYLARRTLAGWGWEGLIPRESYSGILCVSQNSAADGLSNDLSRALIELGSKSSAEHNEFNQYECDAEGLQVVEGEPVGYSNLLLRDNSTGTYRLVNTPPPGVTPGNAHFKGASSDLSHVFFTELGPLAPGAPAGVESLFEWDEGTLRLLTVLPGGASVSGALAAEGGAAEVEHPISTDGSHVLFTSGDALYDRIDGQHTVQVDRTEGPGSSGGGVFQIASLDGSHVFFTDEEKLTPDSTAEAGEPDLYECTLPEGASTCELSDLTVAKLGEHADVRGVSLGSRDSSHVYFTAKGVLAPNKREYEYTDAEGVNHKVEEEATKGQDNIYLAQGGAITFIATESETESAGGSSVSPDGMWLAFGSRKSLTGYENEAGSERGAPEIFLYSAASGQLECASCNPSGEAPLEGGSELPSSNLRPVSDGGRVFFETNEALVPADSNGNGPDVYEYEHGEPALISSGTDANRTTERLFKGVSESGRDVFFTSTQQLVPQDTEEGAIVVYDARIEGGFAAPEAPVPCTTADACRAPIAAQPSLYGAPSSQTFSGVGNLTAPKSAAPKKKAKSKRKCRKGFVRRRRRCAKRRARKKVRKSNHRGRR